MNGQLELEFDDGEILMEKKNVFIYIVPENTIQNSGYHRQAITLQMLEEREVMCDLAGSIRARDWDISKPSGTCTLIMTAAGDCCHIQLEDDSGHVFGQSLVALYPGRCGTLSALNPVSDSSRYFTLKLQQYSGANELIGLGFVDHKDSSDITKTLENFFASHKKLIKAEVKVPKLESEAKVETHTKTEAVEHKLETKLPSVMLNKLENGHSKKEEKCMNLNIESTGPGHSNEVKCEIVEEEERSPPVICSTEKQKSSENDTLHPAGSETDCAELLPGTTQGQMQLSPELQQTSDPSTVEREKTVGYATDRNACSISAGASRGRRRKRNILKKKKQTSAGLKRPKVFECLVCPVNFTYSILQKKLIIKHLTKFHRIEKSKICRICLLSFESEDQIKEHKALSHYHECSHCSMTFTSLKKLKFHLTTIHAKIQQRYSNREEQSSADVLRLNEDQIQPSPKSRPKLSSVTTTAERNQTFPNNDDSSEITTETLLEGNQEEDTSWVLTKKLGLVDITGDTEDNEDTILAFRYHAPGYGFKCHLCPLIFKYSAPKSRIPIFKHWAEVHGFKKPYVCFPCCLLFYSKRHVDEHNLLQIIRCLQCSSLLDGVLRREGFLKHMQMNEKLQSHYYLYPIFTDDETSDTGEGLTFSESEHGLALLDVEEPVQNSQDRGNKKKFINRPIKRSIRIESIKLRKLRSISERHTFNGSNNELDLDTSGSGTDNAQETTTEAPVAMDTDQLFMAPSDINPDPDVTTVNPDPIAPDKVNPELEKVERKSNLNDIRILRFPIGYEFCQPGNVPTCYFCRLVINNSNISEMCKMKCMKLVDKIEYQFICSRCSFNSDAPENQDNEFMHSWSCPHCPAKLKHEGALFYHLFAVHDEI